MPVFVPNGPDIPIEVLNDLDDGKLVLFCGAGISMDTGLPDFKGLVDYLYGTLITPAQDRFHTLRTDPDNSLSSDKQLGLLEAQLTEGRLMRRKVVQRLTVPTDVENLALHRAILSLSTIQTGRTRLVTTNFDDRFQLAGADLDQVDAAPKLPVPKAHSWETLVYLHGRIEGPDDQGRDLVLTSADFGRAYLMERWASRFITELFRSFNVLFVGYSIGDPVLAYMMDALAAELARGENVGRAYAFASFKGGADNQERVETEWIAKNVIPIAYDTSGGDHSLLRETLIHWAERKTDPLTFRANDVVKGINTLPTGPDDENVKRVLWALSDHTGKTAKALAGTAPFKTPSDYKKFIAWVEIFNDAGLLERPAPLQRESGPVRPHPALLVGGSWVAQKPPEPDIVTRFMAVWLAQHVHVPELVQWVIGKGACLHPHMRDLLIRQLAENSDDVPDNVRRVWRLILHDNDHRDVELLFFGELIKSAKDDDERLLLERSVILSLSPRLSFRRPLDISGLIEGEDTDGEEAQGSISNIARIEIEIGKDVTDISLYLIKSAVKTLCKDDPDWLAKHAFEITGKIRAALEILLYLGRASETDDPSYWDRPSISDHEQNSDFQAWTYLLTLARDAYAGLARTDLDAARLLLQMWRSQSFPAFKRLVLHAVTEDENASADWCANLLSDDGHTLWHSSTQRECLRFLRKAAHRISANSLERLIEVVLAGPPRAMFREDLQEERWERIVDREVWLRLTRIGTACGELPEKAKVKS